MKVNRQLKNMVISYLAGLGDREYMRTLAASLDLRTKKQAVQGERQKRKYVRKHPVQPKKRGSKKKATEKS